MSSGRWTATMAILAVCVWVQAAGMPMFNHLTRRDGLLHDNVTCVTQDSAGYMWFGTHRGLNRYDGYRCRSWVHSSDDAINAIYYNRILDIEALDSHLWASTEAGLVCFDMVRQDFVDFESDCEDGFCARVRQLLAIPEHPDLLLLINNSEVRLVKVSAGREGLPCLSTCRIGNSIAFAAPYPVVAASKNHVWFSGNPEIMAYALNEKDDLVYKCTAEGSRASDICAMTVSGNRLWATDGHEISVYDIRNNGKPCNRRGVAAPFDGIIRTMVDGSGSVWIIAADYCLYRFDTDNINRIDVYRHSPFDISTVSRKPNSLYFDRTGMLWVTGWMGGVSYADPEHTYFNLLRQVPTALGDDQDRSGSDFANAIHYADGCIYAPNRAGGLSCLDAKSNQLLWETSGLSRQLNNITAICSTPDEVLVSFEDRFISIDKYKHRQNGEYSSGYGEYIFNICIDSFGHLWCATANGLQQWAHDKSGKWMKRATYTTETEAPKRLSSNILHFIINDADANEIIVSSTQGLNRLFLSAQGEVDSIVSYMAKDDGLSSNYVWPISKACNESHTYWVGTLGSGLNKVRFLSKGYTCRHYGMADGAPSEDIESIEVDAAGRVWCGGKGLCYFDERMQRFSTFDFAEGLRYSSFGTASSCQDNGHRLWFGGVDGISSFDATTEFAAPISNSVRISEIIAPESTFDNNKLTLRHPHNSFTIDISTLSYGTQNSIRYRYRLEGFDREWHEIEAGVKPTVSYLNLPYSNYRLVIEAGNWQQWSGEPMVIDVISRPPWWLEWWAWLVYVLVVGAGIVVVLRYVYKWKSMKKMIAMHEEFDRQRQEICKLKAQLKTNRTDELFNRFVELVNANMANEEFSNDDLWRDLAINRSKLFAMVKENTGMTLGMYVRKMRLDRAAELLDTTDMPIAEVAAAVGIGNPSYFARAFKEQFGVPPSEYVRQLSDSSTDKNIKTQTDE